MGELTNLIEQLVLQWVGTVEGTGYLGIFVMMTIESSFIPFPSEIVMLPAGILAAEGKLNLWGCIAAGTAGSLTGGLVNYVLAVWLGRAFLMRYGKYFFLPADKMLWVEKYWGSHGEMTTFVCRLLPAIRQLISIPAGLARMNLFRFCLFTTLGAGIWVAILTFTGYYAGAEAKVLWEGHKVGITIGLFAAAAAAVALYLLKSQWKRGAAASPAAVSPAPIDYAKVPEPVRD